MSLPRIGITSWPRTVDQNGEAEPNDTVPRAYVRAVRRAGGLPVLLPLLDPADVDDLLASVDGVVVSGGGDVHPSRYGEEPRPELWGVDTTRDEFDHVLWHRLLERPFPVLGVCRGAQTLNVALGGTLVQHLDDHPREHGDLHHAEVAAGSQLAGVVGAGAIDVNSLHHQAIEKPGDGVVVTATGHDGTVEAIEVEGAPHVLAVQWHPELLRHEPRHLALFEDLVRRARASAG